MTKEIYNDCRFCENGRCRVYPWTCDYDDYCSSNEECPIKEMIVKFKRLEQENKVLKSNTNVLNDYITKNEQLKTNIDSLVKKNEKLKQENKELKEENIKVKKEFNNLIAEIISDIEYTGEITCNGESPKEHIKKCQKALKALEEIREINNKWLKRWMNDSDELMGFEEIGNKLNEVLNGI